MTRREILKYGSVAGGALLASTKGPLPRLIAEDNTPRSPATTPFRDPLPVPPAPGAVQPFVLDVAASADLANAKVAAANYYKLAAEQRLVFFHQDFQDRGLATSIWGYKDDNGQPWNFGPGPTFQARINSADAVRVTNN